MFDGFNRKLRKYVGPEEPWPDAKEAKEWSSLSEKIRYKTVIFGNLSYSANCL